MWQITIALDETTTGAGTITGVWTEEGQDGSFTYSARATVDAAGQTEFLAKAAAALKEWQDRNTSEQTISAAITARANKGVS